MVDRKDFLSSLAGFLLAGQELVSYVDAIAVLRQIRKKESKTIVVYIDDSKIKEIKNANINNNYDYIIKKFDTEKPLVIKNSNINIMTFARKVNPVASSADFEKRRVVLNDMCSMLQSLKSHNGDLKKPEMQLEANSLSNDEVGLVKKMIPFIGQTKINDKVAFDFSDPKAKIDFAFENSINMYFPNGQSFVVPIVGEASGKAAKDVLLLKIKNEPPMKVKKLSESDEFKSKFIELKSDTVYKINDIVKMIAEKMSGEWYVDFRFMDSKLLFCSNSNVYRIDALIDVIESVVKLSLRLVNKTYFFSSEDMVARKNQNIEDVNRYRKSLREYFGLLSDSGKFDADMLDIYSGKSWADMSESCRARILQSIEKVPGAQGDLLRQLTASGNVKAQLGFRSDVIVKTVGTPLSEMAAVTVVQ